MKLEPIYWTDLGVTGGGPFCRAEDVDALLASIRAAVEAERECVCCEQSLSLSAPDHEVAETCQATDDARAALDALLSGEGER